MPSPSLGPEVPGRADGGPGRLRGAEGDIVRELDRKEVQRRFVALPTSERRQVLRAVNRGTAAPTRTLAQVTIGVAQRQQRFWRLAWLMGPLLGVIQFTAVPIEEALVNVVAGTAALGAMSLWWFRRARRAEDRTRLLLADAIGPGTGGAERPALPRSSPRPPRPRGRKRG
ncbi:MAG: hypothetical protein RLZZ272_1229 [Actinomycetota bacterium]